MLIEKLGGQMSENEIEKAVDAVVVEKDVVVNPVVTLSSGAVVKVIGVPDYLTRKLFAQFPALKPPQVKIERGGRVDMEDNPDDPEYIEKSEKRVMDIFEGGTRLLVLKGLEVVSRPAGVPDFDDDKEWVEEFAGFGFDVPETRSGRYYEWLRYRVITTDEDILKLQDVSRRLQGISDEDIQAAEQSFPG